MNKARTSCIKEWGETHRPGLILLMAQGQQLEPQIPRPALLPRAQLSLYKTRWASQAMPLWKITLWMVQGATFLSPTCKTSSQIQVSFKTTSLRFLSFRSSSPRCLHNSFSHPNFSLSKVQLWSKRRALWHLWSCLSRTTRWCFRIGRTSWTLWRTNSSSKTWKISRAPTSSCIKICPLGSPKKTSPRPRRR